MTVTCLDLLPGMMMSSGFQSLHLATQERHENDARPWSSNCTESRTRMVHVYLPCAYDAAAIQNRLAESSFGVFTRECK